MLLNPKEMNDLEWLPRPEDPSNAPLEDWPYSTTILAIIGLILIGNLKFILNGPTRLTLVLIKLMLGVPFIKTSTFEQ